MKRRSLVQLVQADLLPILIATILGLTAWYAVSGYLGSYQGGKLWVSAASDAVAEAHANQLASLERRAAALLHADEPSRSLESRESFIRIVDDRSESYGTPVTPAELPHFERLLRPEAESAGDEGAGASWMPRGVMWREGRLYAVVVVADEEKGGVLLSEVTSTWLEHDKRLTAAEVCFRDGTGKILASTYRDTEGAPTSISVVDPDALTTSDSGERKSTHVRVRLNSPYVGAQPQRWHEGASQFSVFSHVMSMESPLGRPVGTVWITVPENVMLGWPKYGMAGTALLGFFFAVVMLVVLRRRVQSVIAPINALSEKLVSLREHFEVAELDWSDESRTSLGERGSTVVADELWKLSQGITELERQMTINRELEGQLRRSQKMEAVGTLAGGIAHDFNNLLSVIVLNTELLFDGLTEAGAGEDERKLSEEDVALFEEVLASSEHGKALTTQLLGMSGSGHETDNVFQFQESIRGLTRMMRRLIPENITVSHELDGEPCLIQGDKNSFAQVLMNLILNARDSLADGRGEISVSGSVRDQRVSEACTEGVLSPGMYAVLSVADTGVGMPEATLHSIFEPFVTSKGQRGTGLGLTVVRHAVLSRFEGALKVSSEEGKGTRFDIFFPIAGAAESGHPEADSGVRRPSATRGGLKLALVEDNDSVRASLVRTLTSTGHTVASFGAGTDLIKWATEHEEEHLELLITDVVMPGWSGPKTYRELDALRPGIKVLFLSGYPGSEFKEFQYEPRQLLQKPVSRADLVQRIEEICG